MSDQQSDQQPKHDKTLSEISHLFLSSIREKQTNGAPRPQRKGPGRVGSDKEEAKALKGSRWLWVKN